MDVDANVEQRRIERDLIIRSAVLLAIVRMRSYRDCFDTSMWSEDGTCDQTAREITRAAFDALMHGRTDEKTVAQRIETVLQENHPDGIWGMQEVLALAWQIQRMFAEFRVGEPRSEPLQVITY
jgi:hypothetical protein